LLYLLLCDGSSIDLIKVVLLVFEETVLELTAKDQIIGHLKEDCNVIPLPLFYSFMCRLLSLQVHAWHGRLQYKTLLVKCPSKQKYSSGDFKPYFPFFYKPLVLQLFPFADGCTTISVTMQKSRQKQVDQLQHKKKALPQKFTIATATLLESCPPTRLSRHLREILLDYISSHKDALPSSSRLQNFNC
jgi:hypothetical protein